MKTKIKKISIIVVIIFLIITSLYFLLKPQEENTNDLNSTITVEKSDLIETLDLNGQVLVANLVEIKTQAIGTIEEIFVKEGETVKAGDKLFKLSLSPEGKEKNNSAYANYLNAKNSLTTAQTNYHNLQSKLFTENEKFKDFMDEKERAENDPELIIARANWLQAEEEYKNQEGKIKQLQINLNSAYQDYLNSSATITASHNGIIESINIARGMTVGDATSVNNSTNLSSRLAVIKIEGQNNLVQFNLSEADIFKVQLDQKVHLILDNYKNSQFEGKIITIDKIGNINNDITTYSIIVAFTNQNQNNVLPNMNVTGTITLNKKEQVLNIPSLALTKDNGKNFVTVLKNNQEQQVEVQTGLTINGRTEIISELSENDQIFIKLKSFEVNQTGGMMPGMGRGMR